MKKRLLYFICFFFFAFYSTNKLYSQQIKEFSDSMSLTVNSIFRNQVVSIKVDSAFLLNKVMFKNFADAYEKNINQNELIKRIVTSYREIINKQDSLIKGKDTELIVLYNNFENLANRTSNYLNESNVGLVKIETNINSASSNIKNLETSINDALKLVKMQKKEKLKITLGGVAIGVSLASIIYLIVK